MSPEYLPWLWVALIVVFGIAESVTFQLISCWFCVGGLAALAADFFGASFGVQAVVFVIVSAVTLALAQLLFRKKLKPRAVATNANMVLGREGTVLRELVPGEVGRVKIDGQDWSARCDTPLAVGERCTVLSLSGVTLTVSPCGAEKKEETV